MFIYYNHAGLERLAMFIKKLMNSYDDDLEALHVTYSSCVITLQVYRGSISSTFPPHDHKLNHVSAAGFAV